MIPAFRITPRAAKDLRSIGRYTEQTWSRKQRDAYLRALDQRFSWLARNPNAGRARPDIKAGYFSFPQGAHLIFYLARKDGIDIIGVLHRRMDVLGYFQKH